MNKIPVIEMFYGIQGEGRYAGTPSVFLRVHGCNLRCCFGMTREEFNDQAKSVVEQTKDITDLDQFPVLGRGCDTLYSILPEYRRFTTSYTVQELADKVLPMLDYGVHLVITGGEPLLPGYQEFWSRFIPQVGGKYNTSVTFETNGTQRLTKQLRPVIQNMNVFFSISPKLGGAGYGIENFNHTGYKEIRNNAGFHSTWLKFVIGDVDDVREAQNVINLVRMEDQSPILRSLHEIYFMPKGGDLNGVEKVQKFVYDECARLKVRFSPRLHVTTAGNGWQT